MSASDPIGVFDSGVGGLSVLREIRRELPGEDLLYVADSAYAPYGEQPTETIEARAIAISDFLIRASAKAIVVACNTATSVAVDALRARVTVPVVGIEPAVKPAAALTKTGVIAVLATKKTLAGTKLSKLLTAHGAHVRTLMQDCPGWVEHVEHGDLSSDETRHLVEQHVAPVLAQGADTLVLGCTHYPFLLPIIQALAGPSVTVIDPAAAVARELWRRLQTVGALSKATSRGTERFWTSGSPDLVQPVLARLWPSRVEIAAFTG